MIELHLGDCLEIMPTLADNSVDVVITDPPYGIKTDMNKYNKWDGRKGNYKTIINDDKEFNPKPFLHFNTIILWGGNNYSYRLPKGGWIVWDKGFSNKMLAKARFSPVELAWINKPTVMELVRILHNAVINDDSKNGNNEPRFHPTQKPIRLMKWCIEKHTKKGETIIDPFMGSGTTGIACVQTGRNFIGIEIEPKYYEIAEKRIAEAQLQMRMTI